MEDQKGKKTPVEGAKVPRFKIAPRTIKYGLTILSILVLSIGAYYWYSSGQKVYSDKAEIFAPLIALSPEKQGILQKVMVKNGDQVSANQIVAKLDGGEFIRAETDGIIVNINDQAGKLFSPGVPVVTMINPDDLRLVVHVAENKGLNSIRAGQEAVFTVDAFNSRKFNGVVEEISQTSDQSSVVFSISDKRDEKYFSIKVRYGDYPELLNGMSAKAWIYK
jgi:multidrug resistance efflux pump